MEVPRRNFARARLTISLVRSSPTKGVILVVHTAVFIVQTAEFIVQTAELIVLQTFDVNPRPAGGRGRIWPPPGFSKITPKPLQISTHNLVYLILHQFDIS